MYYEVLWALDKELFAVKIVNHFFFLNVRMLY